MRPILVAAGPAHLVSQAEQPVLSLADLVQVAQTALADDLETAQQALRAALALVRGLDVSPALSGGLAPWQARKIAAHIEAGLHGPLSVEALAGTVGLSVSYLGRAFKTTFGTPPQAYVLTRRLARARRLMTDNALPLSRIAEQCGFSDPAHFSRQFRQTHGVSPNRWRRRQWVEAETLPLAA